MIAYILQSTIKHDPPRTRKRDAEQKTDNPLDVFYAQVTQNETFGVRVPNQQALHMMKNCRSTYKQTNQLVFSYSLLTGANCKV